MQFRYFAHAFFFVTVVAASMYASSVHAVLLLDETFDYPDGAIIGQSGGTSGTGSWTSAWTDAGGGATHFDVQSGQLRSRNAVGGGAGAVQRTFSSPAAAGSTLYFAYDMNVLQNNEGQYRTLLEFLSGGVRMGVLDDSFRVDLGSDSGGFTPANIAFTGTSQLVARLQFNQIGNDEVLTFWIDPSSEFDAPTDTLQADIGSLDLGSIISFTKTQQESNILLPDNFMLGTDFGFTPFVAPPVPIPEPSSLVLLCLAIGLRVARGRRGLRR